MQDGKLIYLDIASSVRGSDGTALESVISDGIHYTSTGYRMVIDYIKANTVTKN